jgi:hydroxymethylglutaryl-CoA synthase
MFEKMGTEAKDYDHAVFHQPNGKFYLKAAKTLGFNSEQSKTGLLTPVIGNTYSGATPLGLAAILDIAQPGDRILAVSYGSGAGSDAFSITVNDNIEERRDHAPKVTEMIATKNYVDYAMYAKYKGKLRMA